MSLWTVTASLGEPGGLAPRKTEFVRDALLTHEPIKSAEIRQDDGEVISILVVEAEDRAGACTEACGSIADSFGNEIPFSCWVEPLSA